MSQSMSSHTISLRKKPVVLLILDGFGHREDGEDNATLQANMPYWRKLRAEYAYGTIDASERMVGLPTGQFGNSEVGHLNIGAGRVIDQDITRIDYTIEQNTLKDNPVLNQVFQASGKRLHLIGLFSDGGVHSHINHFFAILDIAIAAGVKHIVVHPFLDGRDTPPQSAEHYLKRLDTYCAQHPEVVMGIIVGRFFAMDRDNRWDRVQKAYDALTGTDIPFTATSGVDAIQAAYLRGENDEFVLPTAVTPDATLQDDEAVLFLNFRADRARELTQALNFSDFEGFKRARRPVLSCFASITDYGANYHHPIMFSPISIENSLGEYLSSFGIRQLRIAETEKYPHVTYFFNGGREEPYAYEERIMVPSPKVATYDLQPEMSAHAVADNIVDILNRDATDVVVCNFANGDMVGHTGDIDATVHALETLDACIKKVVDITLEKGGEVLITADHGNCERMYDNINEQVHTQHTTSPVPFLYIGEKAHILEGGALKDIAPTLLALLGLPQPKEMTGNNLVVLTDE